MLRQSAVATEPQLTTPAWVFVWPQGKPESAWADQSCKSALKDDYYRCGSIDVAYKHIKTPLFIAENQFDFEPLIDRNYTYMQSFGTNHLEKIELRGWGKGGGRR